MAKTQVKKIVEHGKVFITATFNNTLVTITDMGGNAMYWSSSGLVGFKGARKATPFAATSAMESIGRKALENGMRDVEVFIKGPGAGRDASLRALRAVGLNITLIADVTPIPHNGVRPKKKRRV
ncbi:MAG: 30S ribosomal protein S11 [Microgenomates group bacterium]